MIRMKHDAEAMREAIIKAAIDVAQTEGWHAVTVRRIADEIGYTAPIVYQYFENKKAMLRHIAEAGYEQLSTTLRSAVEAEGDDVKARFEASGRAYYDFAKRNVEVYQLMHEPLLYQGSDEQLVSANGLFEFLCEEIITLSGDTLDHQAAATRAFQAWATMHGLIMIESTCSVRQGLLKPDEVLDAFGDSFIRDIMKGKN